MNLSFPKKLWMLNIAIILSAVLGVFTSYELKKGGTLHELNSLHLKYNNVYLENYLTFEDDLDPGLSILRKNISDIRDQPVGCLREIGWFEELFLRIISADQAIDICKQDIALADDTLQSITDYENALISHDVLSENLMNAVKGFQDNSSKFGVLVSRTVSKLFQVILFIVLLKAFLLVTFVAFLSRSVSQDYKRLEIAERNANEANEELEEFAYRTSHDLRSPLVSSIKLLDLGQKFMEKGKNTKAQKVGGLSAISLKKLESLISDILSLTKVRHVEEEETVVDVASLVDDALSKVEYLEGFETLKIVKDLNFKKPIYLKRTRLQLIVENLISNAVKYSDVSKEEPFIKIKTKEINENFVLSVEDNGLRIPKDSQNQVFNMFKRFHTKVGFGSGLGLYMIKKSANVLNGEIDYEDTGHGSRFTLRIPKEHIRRTR